jgi:monovalent cation:proton antiporter-2 (CPA2) family protein
MDQHSFLFQAMVYLAAAVIFVPFARKLGLGSVLGYLIAGVVIGPYLLGFVGQEGQDLMHFAEFGVVMMLFLIGLELEPDVLWRMRKSIVGLGGLQLILTTFLVSLIARSFDYNWNQSLVLGMILSMSSTAIALQILTEKGLMKTATGQRAFSVLLFQDIAVIPMLAVLPLLAVASLNGSTDASHPPNWVDGKPGYLQAIIVFGSIAAIIAVGRLLIRPLLRIVAKTRAREMFTASALLIIVGIAVLMSRVGLSSALGAFLAGVVLANSEYRHELESDIEPFKGLLLGLFFIAVGASVDFRFIIEHPWQILIWLLIIMTVKSIVLLVLGKFFKLSLDQNFIFSFSLSQVGEFAFVLLSFTLQQNILSSETVNLMIAVVATSMAMTPIAILINEKLILPRFAKQEEEDIRADEIDEKNQVIIAGFGHFGNTIGRLLRANKISATYLDIDSDRVELLRKMGFKVFYGDASREDLLRSAGAEFAKVIVIAINSPEVRLRMVETVKKHFPNLHMYVRATNRYDSYELMNAGVLHIYRETMDTSLRVGVDVMSLLGYRKYTAKRLARTFFKHDEENLKKLSAIRDPEEYVSESKKYIEEIEVVLQADMAGTLINKDEGWDPESLRREAFEDENRG